MGKIKEKQKTKKWTNSSFFPFCSFHRGVPPFTQGNGWGSTLPWHAT
jgi:hypothetical protein